MMTLQELKAHYESKLIEINTAIDAGCNDLMPVNYVEEFLTKYATKIELENEVGVSLKLERDTENNSWTVTCYDNNGIFQGTDRDNPTIKEALLSDLIDDEDFEL